MLFCSYPGGSRAPRPPTASLLSFSRALMLSEAAADSPTLGADRYRCKVPLLHTPLPHPLFPPYTPLQRARGSLLQPPRQPREVQRACSQGRRMPTDKVTSQRLVAGAAVGEVWSGRSPAWVRYCFRSVPGTRGSLTFSPALLSSSLYAPPRCGKATRWFPSWVSQTPRERNGAEPSPAAAKRSATRLSASRTSLHGASRSGHTTALQTRSLGDHMLPPASPLSPTQTRKMHCPAPPAHGPSSLSPPRRRWDGYGGLGRARSQPHMARQNSYPSGVSDQVNVKETYVKET
ncbi:uncharacterized protein LOC144455148 [Phascolarctos cinereus]